MRTQRLISPPSAPTAVFHDVDMHDWDWISMRLVARILPRTSPPMMASRGDHVSFTSPPFPTSTCRPARTVPLPCLRLHDAVSGDVAHHAPSRSMMDSPLRVQRALPFWWNIPFQFSCLTTVRGSSDFPPADFEVEVRRRGSPGVPGKGDHLPRLHRVAFAHQEARGMPITWFSTRSSAARARSPYAGSVAASTTRHRGAHRRAGGYGDVDAGMDSRLTART